MNIQGAVSLAWPAVPLEAVSSTSTPPAVARKRRNRLDSGNGDDQKKLQTTHVPPELSNHDKQ